MELKYVNYSFGKQNNCFKKSDIRNAIIEIYGKLL